MLQMIFQWLLAAIGGALEIAVNAFMGALDMDMNTYLELFPFLATGYKIFRGIGIGLAVVLASVALLKFLVPSIFGAKEPQDTVPGILFKTFIAAGLIYGGNFILVKIVEIAKIPYDLFIDQSATGVEFGEFSMDFLGRLGEDATGLSAGVLVFEFVLAIVVAWNLIKLMVEVCERYMLVGILVYTSPPFFAMAASSDTIDNFKSWLKMFISACAMMMVSAFFLKLILSGFSLVNMGLTESGGRLFIKLLLLLATCKIAQRADSYLKSIGLGTAVTGGRLLDDLVAAGRTVGGIFNGGHSGKAASGSGSNGSGGGRTSILGAAVSAMTREGGIAGKAAAGASALKESYLAGDGMDAMQQKMAQAFRETNTVPNSLKSVGNIVDTASKSGASAADVAAQTGKEALNTGIEMVDILAPGAAQERQDNIAAKQAEAYDAETDVELGRMEGIETENQTAKENIYEKAQSDAEFAGPANPYGFTAEMEDKYLGDATPSPAAAAKAFAEYGAIDPDNGSSVYMDAEGNMIPSPRAKASGITYQDNENAEITGKTIAGEPERVAEVIAGGYNPAEALDPRVYAPGDASTPAYAEQFQGMAIDTINTASPEVADHLLHNPNMNIRGVEGEAVGAAAVSRLYPDIAPNAQEIRNVTTRSRPDITNSQGEIISGGHEWTADIGEKTYTAIDRTAYSSLSETERSEYTRHTLPTGRVEYIKSIPIEQIPPQPQEVVHSHYVHTEPARIRNTKGGRVNPSYRSRSDIQGFPDMKSASRKYSEQRDKNRPGGPRRKK